jgi:hypothetical protein
MKLWPRKRQSVDELPKPQAGKPATLSRGHLNDLTKALGQQMFFWGRDVLHPSGNLLMRHGFEKRESPGLKGTSCYRKAWRQGFIELHGACAGWYPEEQKASTGFLFIRTDRRCYAHRQAEAVIPGHYDYDKLTSGDVDQLSLCSQCFSAWLAEYEAWVRCACGPQHRQDCHAMFAKLPASQPWLPPEMAEHWLRLFAYGQEVPRAGAWRRQARSAVKSTS